MSEKNTVGIFLPQGIEALVCLEISKRQAYGLNKYKISVADNPLSLRQWLQHALEENLDAAVYLRRAIAEIDAAQPHPPTRHCGCPACLPSFDDSAVAPEEWTVPAGTATHPLASECPKCKGAGGEIDGRNCPNCQGLGTVPYIGNV